MVATDEPQTQREVKLRPLTPTKLREHLVRTLKRAYEAEVHEFVERVEYGLYLVPSTSRGAVVYTITGTDAPLECTCEAQWHMPLCVHRAAVWLCRWQSEGREVTLDTLPDLAPLAYPEERWPALVQEAPPWTPDRTLDLEE